MSSAPSLGKKIHKHKWQDCLFALFKLWLFLEENNVLGRSLCRGNTVSLLSPHAGMELPFSQPPIISLGPAHFHSHTKFFISFLSLSSSTSKPHSYIFYCLLTYFPIHLHSLKTLVTGGHTFLFHPNSCFHTAINNIYTDYNSNLL